jgi:hypothetical protein
MDLEASFNSHINVCIFRALGPGYLLLMQSGIIVPDNELRWVSKRVSWCLSWLDGDGRAERPGTPICRLPAILAVPGSHQQISIDMKFRSSKPSRIIPSLKFTRSVHCKLYPLPLVYSSLAVQNTQMLDVGRGLCMPAGDGRYRPRTVYSPSPVLPGCPTARLTSLVASDFLLNRFSRRR